MAIAKMAIAKISIAKMTIDKMRIGKKRVTAMALMFAMSISMTACGTGQEQGTQGSAEESSAAEQTMAEQIPENSAEQTEEQETQEEQAAMNNIESSLPGTIYVEGSRFMVNGQEIWINGVNTPWDNWNDFGGSFDGIFWNQHFQKLHEAGVNSTRIWITCNGDVGIDIDENGYVTGATEAHWAALDLLFTLAERHGIYIMATLMSFDHFKDENQNHLRWRAMVQDDQAIDSYVQNYVIPFCRRYDAYNALWSIDLCNEPDWVHENQECGKLAWKDLSSYFARAAAAIHENSDVLVTVGIAMVKNNSDKYEGNYASDTYLQSCYDNENAYMDFYSPHYYEWMAPWYGIPFDKSPEAFGMDTDRPVLIGEFPALGLEGTQKGSQVMNTTECYLGVYENGWNGIMAWTSNGVDACGGFNEVEPAAGAIYELVPEKVFPE